MPRVEFDQLPSNARVWIFASDRSLHGDEADVLLEDVDAFLAQWKAHGAPLRNARDWREDRFLTIGVDPTAEQASGCSIDGLFRALQAVEGRLATSLVAGGRVFYRDAKGRPELALRKEVSTFFAMGKITADTSVFDTSITDAKGYRERFERPVRDTWVASLLPAQASQSSSRVATKSSSARNG
ncbi:MAG: hypothetical protein WD825_06495 [Gemmatimonadaceae bacterium]